MGSRTEEPVSDLSASSYAFPKLVTVPREPINQTYIFKMVDIKYDP